MLNKIKEMLLKPENKDMLVLAGFLGIIAVIVGFKFLGHSGNKESLQAKNDPRAASVMITNREMNHGGTGIIIQSTPSRSSILTNDHVCRAIKEGGIVKAKSGDYQIASMIESEQSDLCLIQVLADLNVNTNVADRSPEMYDKAMISGHPALMPNVLSYGHVSGRRIIEVMTGIRPCTDEDLSGPLGIACIFFGGMPVVKSFESVLVTATIMPGSSGSGVYNTNKDLVGVVFAGSGELGYAWTVPYEQVLNFLYREHTHLKVQNLSQEINLVKKDDSAKKLKETLSRCDAQTDDVIIDFCTILKRDQIWRQ